MGLERVVDRETLGNLAAVGVDVHVDVLHALRHVGERLGHVERLGLALGGCAGLVERVPDAATANVAHDVQIGAELVARD